ncbi:GNAT family N-acetyltransferase [Poseidonocella sedimentorum]|uniref:Acetyltransferase (GNAT) family protein n=1 Tax=Poseidonocella sedimentorum TaxID=871652 RepID=A0A1I6D8V8_9RHOB|nr:GNAT family N-acetyltransferase [Poseidonocella sedimentorum]SFR01801.1 Acetyltransferase (GNAT) family protein [Poseidonocella sedimentorum]
MTDGAQPWLEAMEATWPPARTETHAPITLRDGQGGGKRVSAASVAGAGALAPEALRAAEDHMRARAQAPLFMITPNQRALDAQLEAEGYGIVDPVHLYGAPVAALAGLDPGAHPITDAEAPLAIMSEIWAEDGVGASRRAVMARTGGPRSHLLTRHGDRAAGVGFIAAHGEIAMIHALYVRPIFRRKGQARALLRHAALWARERGAARIGLAVTRANGPANALYRALGMETVGGYHYRLRDAARDAA